MNAENYLKLVQFYQDYAAAVDQEDWDAWLNMFTDDAKYKVQSRENYDRDLPMAVLNMYSKNMLKDRVYGMTETIFHEPYHQCHVVASPRVISASGGEIEAQANYSVFRTKTDGIAEVYNVGRYIDRIQVTDQGFKLASRLCVFDNEMVLNSMIYPI
ncbi:aromatic-ring-hydroxylating dioxygenase subunit beta [Maribrevibacterium harenarium]|uniref:Aromatic-ring-hydroxylating dioxygenase subunit beta n=1 Tax=Maribrevibacterium harenarium TaxID=2589817 RepID=A0A501WFE0_9GAMM|nr:aromatic-ring-hydroxylating dioxygenase subunit beta [Maribrevibacterium harenarium]TPE48573.1 aromatic-ring-hydroxylating dioxygenase subunit beta [Maribrevibacterium harenarium]